MNLLKTQTAKVRWHVSLLFVKAAIWLLTLSGWYKGYWNQWRTIFAYAESKGLHIMPVHYYSPIPNTAELPDELWLRDRLPVGFDLRIDPALSWLDRLSSRFASEYSKFPEGRSSDPHMYYLDNDAYSYGDAEILYAIIRDLKPRKIIEIGSGCSTLLICQAIRANRENVYGYRCEFTAIEPFPPAFLRPAPDEVTRIIAEPVQQISPELFLSLEENDILFIDSTHVVGIGSDVVYEYLTVLPRLAPGVLVHIHDIFIPADYPRRWIHHSRFFWNEQYLLEAFLTFNHKFEVVMPTHAIWAHYNEQFRSSITSDGHRPPKSFWIRRRPD